VLTIDQSRFFRIPSELCDIVYKSNINGSSQLGDSLPLLKHDFLVVLAINGDAIAD